MANFQQGIELRSDILQRQEPAHLRGDVIIAIESALRRRPSCGEATNPAPTVPDEGRFFHRSELALWWGRKMTSLKIFQSDESKVKDDRYKHFISQKLEAHPKGYPRLAAYIDSEFDDVIFRRFGILHVRSLLYKQAELTELETRLQKLDKEDEGTSNDWKLHSHINLSRGDNSVRKELMHTIELKLKEYDELLLRDHQIRNLRKASRTLHRSVFNYIFNRHPVTKDDEQFIYHRDDFVRLTNHVEFNWLDDFIYKFMDYDESKFLRNICTTKEDRERSTDPYIRPYSRDRLGVLMSTFIAFVSTFLLLIPVYVLTVMPTNMQMMATVVLGFVFLFAAALSFFTGARRLDVFIATASYAAVLCVFLGNWQQSQGIKSN